MNDVRDEARDLQLDAIVREALGDHPPEDLAARIAERLEREDAAPPRGRGQWLKVAAVLLGTAVVAAVMWSKAKGHDQAATRPDAPPSHSTDERNQGPPDAQDPDPRFGLDETTFARVQQLVRDLEAPERRDAAIQALAALGPKVDGALAAAIADETKRGRTEVLAVLELARHRVAMTAAKKAFGLPDVPITLIADYSDSRVEAVDDRGRKVWDLDDLYGVWDAELTATGTMLITNFSVSSVIEVDRTGKTIWSYENLRNPYDADRLPNGNTLIADTMSGRVIEVDRDGRIVWAYDKGVRPFDCDRLANGNTLIADTAMDRVIEVSPAGDIVWEVKGMPNVHDADRLPNGNTLITLRSAGRVVEVDRDGKIVWKLDGLHAPSDADRLLDGHTIVAENAQVREFDAAGKVVWTKEMTWAVEINRY